MIAGTVLILAAVDVVPGVAHFAWVDAVRGLPRGHRDPLTGLLNRRGADVSVEPLWSAATAAGDAVAVLVVDVDDFKRINDDHGHDEGDRTLVRIADALDAAVGEGVLARTGGVRVHRVPHGYTRRVAASDRRGAPLDRGRRRDRCSISVGAAVIPEGVVAGSGLDVVLPALRVADTLMYEAKQRGGGRALTTDVDG